MGRKSRNRRKQTGQRKFNAVTVRSLATGEVLAIRRASSFLAKTPPGRDWISGPTYAHLGFKSYDAYLRSKHWRAVRKRWIDAGRPQCCSVCGSEKYQLHHRTYERLGRERLDDLVALCGGHHKAAHALVNSRKANLGEADGMLKPVHPKAYNVLVGWLRPDPYGDDFEDRALFSFPGSPIRQSRIASPVSISSEPTEMAS